MSNHPEPLDYTVQLARSLFPCLEGEFHFSPIPHCGHAPTPCSTRIHPARDNARSWSLLLLLRACLSRTGTVTTQVFGIIFLSAGLFHFKLNVLLSLCFSTGYSIQPNSRSTNSQQQILSSGKTARQDTSLLVSQHGQHVHDNQLGTFYQHFLKLLSLSMW